MSNLTTEISSVEKHEFYLTVPNLSIKIGEAIQSPVGTAMTWGHDYDEPDSAGKDQWLPIYLGDFDDFDQARERVEAHTRYKTETDADWPSD